VLVTKTTAYAAIPVALCAVLWSWWEATQGGLVDRWRELGKRLLAVFGLSLLVGVPLFVRNALVYGWPDILGLQWHNAIVEGQPRTADWIAGHGLGGLLGRFAQFTFKSFWGVFGWMGVFLDNRLYLVLAVLSVVAAVGFVVFLVRWATGLRSPEQEDGVARRRKALGLSLLLAAWIGWTLLQYLGYNVTFVQHQGRYLFPALVPIGLVFALGWKNALRPGVGRAVGIACILAAVALAVAGLFAGSLPVWSVVLVGLSGAALLVWSWQPRQLEPLVMLAPYVVFVLLDIVSLFWFVLPQLT
jgi:hypothetical protein